MLKPLLVVLALLLAAPPASAAAGRATRVVLSTVTDPATGNLRPGYTVAERHDGSCPTGSTSSARADAWRCAIGYVTLDPCFAPAPNARLVYCPQPGGRNRLLAISLAKPLPLRRANRRSPGAPLSLALGGGVTCGRENGATGLVGGMRITYTCSDGRMLLGDVDRGSPRWRIHATSLGGAPNPALVGIETATF